MTKRFAITSLVNHPLVAASTIVFSGSMMVNAINYFFTLILGRLLTPGQFGEVVALLSLMVITSVPSVAIKTIVAKFAAELKAKNMISELDRLFKRFSVYSWTVGAIFLVGLWLVTPVMTAYLKVDGWAYVVFVISIPLSLAGSAVKGLFQGTQNFVKFSLIDLIAAVVKIALGVWLIMEGLSVLGVMLAIVIGMVMGYLYGLIAEWWVKRRRFKSEDTSSASLDLSIRGNWRYASGVFWATLLISLFVNQDIILAKHYLESEAAGYYSGLATVGKLITYGTTAFVTVMFPMVSAAGVEGAAKRVQLLRLSLLIMSVLAVGFLGVFILLPDLVIKLILGSTYLPIRPYLPGFGLGVALGTLGTTVVNYFLASGETRFIYPLTFTIGLQFILITLFHSNLRELTWVMVAVGAILLTSMLMTIRKTP